MANNLKDPLEDPPSSPSKEIESDEEDQNLHTIFSSEEEEDPPVPRSGSKKDVCGSSGSQLSGRKRLSTNVMSSNVAKKIYTQQQGGKMGTNRPCFTRLFSDKDEIVLLQAIIDSKGKNPLQDNRPLYESMKGSFSFDVTFTQLKNKIGGLKTKYALNEKRGERAVSASRPHEQKCFQLSKAIWGAAVESAISSNSQSKENEWGLTKKLDLVTPRKGKNHVNEGSSKRGDTKKSTLVEKESADWYESSFFLGMDFLKAKWTKVPPTESKKETQEKMKKLHANELQCQKFQEMLKDMKDKCAHDKVELLNEVTSLIMAAD